MITWMPDSGVDGPTQPAFSLSQIAAGRFDSKLKALSVEMKDSGLDILLRPMPEPNTPWYPWAGTTNGNTPEQYAAAWRRVRTVVRKNAGKRVRMLWSPYVRSIPDTDANAISKYFPGVDQVEAVGVSGYNFGAVGELAWTDPATLFASAYKEISAIAPKPFWISETGSTATGGDKAAWMTALAGLRAAMPTLRGVVWFDVAEPTGDFRLSSGPAETAAFRTFLKGRCSAA